MSFWSRNAVTDLPTWLRGLREREALSQAELGIRIGVTRASVNRWENSQTYPSARDRQALNDLARACEYPAIVPRWRT
jgi:transcriptional regulator with XRE-family HTH domain